MSNHAKTLLVIAGGLILFYVVPHVIKSRQAHNPNGFSVCQPSWTPGDARLNCGFTEVP